MPCPDRLILVLDSAVNQSNLVKIKIGLGCDIGLLNLPDNGKAWNYNNATKRWELDCEEKYEIERVSYRDYHRCKYDGTWAWPSRVIVKCRFSSEAIHEEIKELEKLEDKMEELAEEMAEDRQIAFNMASKMAEDREMTERMAKEISDNLKISQKTNDMMIKIQNAERAELLEKGRGSLGNETDTAILVLNTKPFAAKPMIFDLNANVDDNLNWEYRNLAGAFFGCAVVFNDTMFYFGGVGADSTQYAKVENCGLTRDPTKSLPFDFEGGTCKTYPKLDSNDGKDEIVYLCFGDKTNRNCSTFDADGNFDQTSVPMTNHEHSFVQLATYNNRPFITGSFESLDVNNNRTEYLMNVDDEEMWFEADDYPDGKFIAFYSTVSTLKSVFIIGGRRESQKAIEEQYTDLVVQFTNNTWKIAKQRLQYQRVGHASILLNSNSFLNRTVFYVFGGSARDADGNSQNLAVTELWEITEDDEPKLFDGIGVNPYRSPYVKSRDYQFGIALYKINSNTTELPNKCAKSN